MVFESKKTLIASAIFNVIMIICISCLAISCSRKNYVLNKKVSEQNKTITRHINFEKVIIFYLYSLLANCFNGIFIHADIEQHNR